MTQLLQDVFVALLVVGSTGYAAATLMPSGWRRSAAGRLSGLPFLPARLAETLRVTSRAASGCGCDGCDRAPKQPPPDNGHAPAAAAAAARRTPTAQPITFHPRVRR